MDTKLLYNDRYASISEFENYLEFTWKPDAYIIDDNDFLKVMAELKALLVTKKYNKILVDITHLDFTVDDEINSWLLKWFYPDKTTGTSIKKAAVVKSQSFVVNLSHAKSLEQVQSFVDIAFFDDRTLAFSWLMNGG